MNTHCSKTVRSRPPARRRGVVLIAAIVCVVVGSAVFLSILKMTATGRNVLQSEAQRIQAAWLAESALQRAAARLAADPDYEGETWNVPAARDAVPPAARDAVKLSLPQSAKVRIDVVPVAGHADRRLVRVRADYPDHPHYRVRYDKQIAVHVSLPNGEEP